MLGLVAATFSAVGSMVQVLLMKVPKVESWDASQALAGPES